MNIFEFIKKLYKPIADFIGKAIILLYSRYLVHTSIIVGVAIIFILSFKLEITHGRAKGFLDIDFWLDNLIPNIIADMIGILLTTFIIAGLFARNTKINEEKELFNLIGRDFNKLMIALSRNYLYLLKREEELLSSKLMRMEHIKEALVDISEGTESRDIFKIVEPLQLKMERDTLYEVQEKGMISTIPRLQSYLEELVHHEESYKELQLELDRVSLHLEVIESREGKESIDYREKFSKYQEISRKILGNIGESGELFTARKRYENFMASEVMEGFINFFNNKVNEFYNKYNFLIPMDMRLSFSKLEKDMHRLSRWIKTYMSAQELEEENEGNPAYENLLARTNHWLPIRTQILESSKEIENLLTYFDKLLQRKYLP